MDLLYSPWNINWKQYLGELSNSKSPLYQLNKNNIQFIFLINQKTNLHLYSNIYEISGSKIKYLDFIGPFICKKKIIQSNSNIWENLTDYYHSNPHSKWWGIYINQQIELYNVKLLKNIISKPNFAIIIPYRNRINNLQNCLPKLEKYYQSQKIDFDIWIIQQNNWGNWNKGTTFNIGFLELKDSYDYFILNDLDTIPTNNLPFYQNFNHKFKTILNNQVLHLIGYHFCLGGMFIFNKYIFEKINGFCNMFNNWGREDRELQNRLLKNNIIINNDYLNSDFSAEEHNTDFNYWTQKNNKKLKARYYYYLNQIAEYKSQIYRNDLRNLKKGNIYFNKKIIYRFVFDKYSNGFLKINLNIYFEFDISNNLCIFNKQNIFPINSLQNNPIVNLEIIPTSLSYCKLIVTIDQISHIVNLNNPFNIDWNYQTDLSLIYAIFYTPFNTKEINYSSEIKTYPYYQINVSF